MFDLSRTESQTIDSNLEPKLAWATGRQAECEQMALDATRLLSCTENRLQDYVGQGFFKRCWSGLSGKTGEIMRANQNDLIEMQKYAWRYINLLQERQLLLAHSLITVKNNLLTLAVEQDEIKKEIHRLAERVLDRIEILEDRIGSLEKNVDLLDWVTNIETRDYDDKFPKNMRILRIIGDFFAIKPHSWNVRDLAYLRTALKNTGFAVKEEISIGHFVDGLLGEIGKDKIHRFSPLICPPVFDGRVSDTFVFDAVASPTFCALYEIKSSHSSSSNAVSALSEHLEISHEEAIKIILNKYIQKRGVDRDVSLPLKDLAIELLGCFGLLWQLSGANVAQKSDAVLPKKENEDYLSFKDIMLNAKKGNSDSQYKVGLAYYNGIDVEEDDESALSWFAKAAKQGHPEGQYMLGLMYHEGFGLDKQREEIEENDEDGDDIDEWENSIKEEAISLFLAAAKKGDIDAQYMLGCLYYDGIDDILEQDHEEAFSWFMKAAEQGDPQSQEKIAEMYRNGEGVDEDDEQAALWSVKAEEQEGDENKRKHRSNDPCTTNKRFRTIDRKLKALEQAASKMLESANSLPDDDDGSGDKTIADINTAFFYFPSGDSSYYLDGERSIDIKHSDDFDMDKIENAVNSYANEAFMKLIDINCIDSSDVVAYYDDTAFGGGDDGFIATTEAFYYRAFLGDPGAFKYENMIRIEIKSDGTILVETSVDSDPLFTFKFTSHNMESLFEALKELGGFE